MIEMRKRVGYFLSLTFFFFLPQLSWAQFDKVFKTNYTNVHYLKEDDLDDFIWRLGGRKLEFSNEVEIASSRIDRIISRVQTILDMWPRNFKLDIYLHRDVLEFNKVAYHDSASQSIHICVDYASDGVVAHEIAHAVISQYFSFSPPGKMNEILAQYVDKHLWSDY